MTLMIPSAPLASTTPEVARLFRALRSLPDDQLTAWHRLTIGSESNTTGGADFWLMSKNSNQGGGRCLFLQACALRPRDVLAFRQGQLFTAEDPLHLLKEALESLKIYGKSFAACECSKLIPVGIVFTQLSPDEIVGLDILDFESAKERYLETPDWKFGPLNFLAVANLQQQIEELLGPALGEEEVEKVRQLFCPEVMIPDSFTASRSRLPASRRHDLSAKLSHFSLDYDQESIVKSDMEFGNEAEKVARDFSLRVINGVAGSGKSLILVYRACLLAQLFPKKKILILTHNQPLIRDLRRRYKTLSQGPETALDVLTFYQWCRKFWPRDLRWRDPISQESRRRLLRTSFTEFTREAGVSTSDSLSEGLVLDELSWVKDQLIFSEEEYLAADRSGRGFPLTEAQRQRLYAIFSQYQAKLNQQKRLDWDDVPRQLHRLARAGRLELPLYDTIMIDEAQFFAPLWFDLIKRCLKPRFGSLFMVADPAQGFLKRGNSWLSLGLDVRGKVKRLKRCYRTTRPIFEFAFRFYRSRVAEDWEELTYPDFSTMPGGVEPEVLTVNSEQDEITRAVNEVAAWVSNGVPPKDILLIHCDGRGVKVVLDRLSVLLGKDMAVDVRKDLNKERISVCSLNAATGLESSFVVLLGSSRLLEQEANPLLSEFERRELIRDNSRRLYMAMTRAAQRLLITCKSNVAEIYLANQ